MAQNQANFGLNFRVDKSGLNDLKKSLQDIMKLGQQKSATGEMTKELEQACKAAKQLEGILDGAWNSKLGQLNLDKVNQGIQTTFKSVGQLKSALDASGGVGTSAYNKMASQILSTNLQLKQTNKLLDDMAVSMANTVKWGITSSIFNNMTRSVQDAFYYVKGLNSSLTDIRIVTGASADQMASFAEKANAAAKALGQTTRNYTDASLIYYQQGLSEADVEARTQTTLKAANVTGQSTEEVSELLTSVWNGYKVSAAEAEIYIDKIAAVATTTASDLEELSIGMSKVASAASLMGVDIDQLNAQLATIVSVTRQAPESVGTALKTIYARMGDIEAGLDGETTLGNYTEQMKEMGFNVLDAQGKLRDMGGVIEEIGGKWSSMTREQQLSLAQTVAGTRQYNNLLALFDNWDMYTNALNTSNQAMGTLQEQNDIYMQSTEAHLKQLKAEAEETYSALLKAEDINVIVDAFAGALDQLNDFIDGLGGGINALTNFGAIATRVFDKQIANSILRMQQNLEVAKINKAADDMKTKILAEETKKQNQMSNAGIDAESVGFKAQVEAAKEVHAVRNSLTQEQYQETLEIQKQIALETNKLETLKQQKNAVEDFTEEGKIYKDIVSQTDDEIQDQINKEKEKNKELENSIQALQKIRDLMEEVERLNIKDVDEAERKAQEVQELATKYESEIRDGLFAGGLKSDQREELVENMKNFQAGDTAFKEVANINKSIEESKKQQKEHTAIIEAGTSALNKRHTSFDEEIESTKKIIDNLKTQNKEYVNIGNKVSKIIKNVQTWATVGQILTAVGGGLSVIFDEASTGAEKANAGFQTLVSTASAFGPYGMLAAGILTVAKAGLEAVGWWEKIEDLCKSTSEKLAEIDEGVSKNNLLNQQTNSQISSLKAIEEEYALLSVKAGQYGENLDEMTEEEQNRYHELTNAFTQYNEAVILGYDAQGNAIVNNQTALKETIRLLREQAEERARENLGDISEALKTKQKNIDSAQKEYDDAKAESDFYQTEEGAKERTDSFKEKVQQVSNLLTYYADGVDESVHESVRILSESLQNTTSLTDEQFTDSFNTLSNAYDAAINYINNTFGEEGLRNVEIGYSGLKEYFSIWDDMQGALVAAESQLEQAQKFDTNWIMQVLQFGEGYDDQWDSLSYEGQDIGYNLVLQYLEGITYGVEEGQADKYEDVIAMGQTFITGLQQAIDVGFTNIETAASDFNTNKDNIKLTVSQREEAIKNIILEEIQNIGNFSELEEPVKEALELMFENAFNIDLELNDQGQISTLEHKTRQYLKNAQTAINDAAKENFIPDESVSQEYLESLLSPEELQNIDQIIQNIDWSRMRVEGLSLEEALIAAKEAAENGQTVISKLREEATMGEDILNKLQNKEELTNDEMAYLNSLAEEEEILQGLAIGTEEYNNALLEVLATRKKNNEIKLRNEIKDTTDELRIERADNDRIKAEQKEYLDHGGKKTDEAYINMQAAIDVNDTEITALEAYLANLQYEILCLAKVEADPDIASQIRNLYSDADTLISIRTTLEDDKALSEEQTQALGGFFASESGQDYAKEYAETGVLTEQMLIAIEAFAQGKQELGDIARTSLEEEIQEYLSAADLAKQEAQNLREQGDIQGAEEKEEEATTNYSAAATRTAELVQINSEEVANIATEIDSLEELNEVMENGRYEADQLSEAMDTVAENILKAEGIDTDGFEDYVEVLEDMYEQTGLTTTQIKKMAIQDKILAKGLDNLNKNFKTWSTSLKATSKGNEDWSDTVSDMTECVEDLTGIKVSEDFFNLDTEEGIRNLELLEEAMSGTQEDLLNLQEAAAKDLIINSDIQLSPEMQASVLNEVSNVYDMMQSMLDSGELTVGQNINDGPLLTALSNIVSACSSSVGEAEALLAKLGFNATVVEEETPPETFTSSFPTVVYSADGEVPVGDSEEDAGRVMRSATAVADSVEVTTTQGGAKATALKVESATYTGGGNIGRSGSAPRGGGSGKGGGGKGGGGGKTKAAKKVGPRKKNYYHDVNNSLTKLGNQYEKLAEQQDKTFGQKHIDNIKKTNENLDEQINKMRERINIAKKQEKKDLKTDIQKNYKDVKFNKDGTIKNYEEVLQKYYDKYANKKQSQESQEKNKEKYDKLKELLDEYETLILETIPEWEAEIREKIDEKYENLIGQFEYEIEMRINWGETDRDVREFFKNFNGEVKGIKTGLSEIDFEGLANFEKLQLNSFINSDELTSKTRQIGDIIKEIKKIDDANAKGYKITNKDEEQYFSDVYGDNKQAALEDLKERREGLMEDLESMKDARDNAYDTYLDAIDDGIEKMDKHIEQYEIINEEISHNMNLIEMLYGETSDMMEAQYDLQEANYLGQLKSLKTISDTYKTQLDAEKAAVAAMEASGDTTSQAYADAKERVEIYEDAYNESVSNLQATTEEAVQNLIDKYAFGVKQVLDNMANSLFDSKDNPTLNTALTEWELMNKESEMYLDNINAAFEIQKLESKYKDVLNATDSITAQKKLNGVMESELGMLREKDKLSQYEIDHANLIYELTLKQIALEEAQQNKSKMRLRRDAQGNYSYQFTADTENINKAQEDVNDVLQQLTNLSQEKGKEIYDTALNETQNFIERMAEIEAMADGAEKERLKELTQANYNRVMTDLMSQSELVERHIGELVSGPLSEIMEEEKQLFDGDEGISTKILSLTKTLRENIAGKGGMTNIVGSAMTEIKKKSDAYLNSLKQIETATGKTFEKLSDSEYVEGIKNNISDLTSATDNLAGSWKTTLDNIKLVIDEMDKALKESEKVQAALDAVEVAEKKEKTEYKAAGDTAEKANKDLVKDSVPDDKKPTKTEEIKQTETKKETKTTKKTKKIKVGGKVKAKGHIYDANGRDQGTQYFSDDPRYKVLKISGNLVKVRWHKLSSGVTGYFKKSQLTPLRSGGYTGDWNGDNGKVALLHKKELVLNQQDTQNILDAVNIIRGLGGLLQNSMVSRIEGLTQSLNGISIPTVQNNPETGPQSVEQTVHITAEFPGATEVIQIEQALENLVSRASQYAFRRRE